MGQGNSEPSMEEILSSIKRIIAEEGEAPSPRPRKSRPAPVSAAESEVLELTETVGDGPEVQPVAFPPADPVDAAPPPAAPAPSADELMSASTAAASRAALAALSRMVVRPDDPKADNTLEGLVRDMLRPMLKEWLDAHLPDIVNAAVAREVARISGRSG